MRRLHARTLLAAAGLAVTFAACAKGEVPAADSANAAAEAAGLDSSAPTPRADTGADTGAAAPTSGAMLDPNTATREQLAALPGMDAALADSIVAKRPYTGMVAVDRVLATRLSESQRDTVYARLFRPIDLNTAKPDEMQLIPGVGKRMSREFEEYRPWKTVEQFRREIGKYVDDAEVARLEKYVAIR